jgi:hypothetical protein
MLLTIGPVLAGFKPPVATASLPACHRHGKTLDLGLACDVLAGAFFSRKLGNFATRHTLTGAWRDIRLIGSGTALSASMSDRPAQPVHCVRIRAAFETVYPASDSVWSGDGMARKNERQERLAREREDIAERIAKFKATQDRFMREREEYAAATWRKASPQS